MKLFELAVVLSIIGLISCTTMLIQDANTPKCHRSEELHDFMLECSKTQGFTTCSHNWEQLHGCRVFYEY